VQSIECIRHHLSYEHDAAGTFRKRSLSRVARSCVFLRFVFTLKNTVSENISALNF